jgi:hypothetical protein
MMSGIRNFEDISNSINQCMNCSYFKTSQCPYRLRRLAIQNIDSQRDSNGEINLIEHGSQKSNKSGVRKDLKLIRKECTKYQA